MSDSIDKHYENLCRVKAHAAVSYYKNSKSSYSKQDVSKLETDSAYIHRLLEEGSRAYELSKATDRLFDSITFALGRRKPVRDRG